MICISLCTAYIGEMLCDNIPIRSLVVISIIRMTEGIKFKVLQSVNMIR